MSDNRPTVGYIVMCSRSGPQSWSNQERALFSSTSCQVFPTKGMANMAINHTIDYAIKHEFTWTVEHYQVHRLVTARFLAIP